MPQKSQSRPSLQQTPAMQTSYSNTVADTLQSDDDDDICPVCESECTCNLKTTSAPSASITQPPIQSQPAQPSQLKIRLTVPPSMFSSLHSQSRPSTQSSKQKLTTSVSARDGGSAEQEMSPVLVKRKRGRPTKAETEARRAANMEHAPTPANRSRTSTASNKIKAQRKLSTKRQKNKATPKARPQQRRFEDDSNTSSNSDDEDTTPARHFKPKAYSSEAEKVANAGMDSDLSELSSLPDPGDESSLEAEEERYIIQEASPRNNDKSRVKRELLGDENNQRRFDRLNQNRHSWEVRTGGRSLSRGAGDSSSDSDSDSDDQNDSEGQEGDEEDADADEDADMEDQIPTFLPSHRGIWSDIDSTEEDFDADVFFASLSDSDTSTADFENVFQAPHEDEAGEEETERMDTIQIDDTLGGGLLAPFAPNAETTVLVSRDFNGQPVFTNGSDFTMGMLDLDFELNIVAQQRSAIEQNGTFPSATSACEDDEMWIASETEDADLDSEHGDTTDDDISVLRGVQTASGVVMFRFPTPPISSINPLSTLSPMPKKNSKSSCAKKRKAFEKSQRRHSILLNPKNSEIHSNQPHQIPPPENNDGDAASDSGHSSSLSSSKRHPTMGRFETQAGPMVHHVIINGDGKNFDIPSPISPNTLNRARTRSRRDSGSSRGRKRGSIRNESPASMLSRRHARSPVSSRSISTDTRTKSSHDNSETSAAPPVTPIDIDEVLDSSLMDHLTNDNEVDSGAGGRHEADPGSKHLDRWDRVPMGAFRQTRHTGARASISESLASVMEWAPNQPSAISDGFCYGSPGGSLMRSRTLPLFDSMDFEPSRRRSALQQSHLGSPTAQKRPASGCDSGIDGDQTPTASHSNADITAAFGNTPEEEPLPKILSHKARRKAKRRLFSGGDN